MKTLRYLGLTIIMCCLLGGAKAQYVTIPDAAFVTWLQANYPACMNGNQMDTTCAGIVGAQYIECSSKSIYDLSGLQFFDSLTALDCSNNILTYLPPLPPKLLNLRASNNQLITLPTFPDSLLQITVSNNSLTGLPLLPSKCNWLYVDNNHLDSLPSLPLFMHVVFCDNNNISLLPVLPDSLEVLSFRHNFVNIIPPLPLSLLELWADDNPLLGLPALPASLNTLTVTHCNLSFLPALPPRLYNLYCGWNQLTSLPVLPPLLEGLGCGTNQLTSLPALPTTLLELDCRENGLTAIPNLSLGLERLDCAINQLAALPTLPSTLKFFICSQNNLTSIPPLPDSLAYFICDQNPQLHCLPRLTRIGELRFDSIAIACLPNYGVVWQSVPTINNYPLCAPGSGCQVYWNISGTVYNDSTNNCHQDVDEINVPHLKVKLWQGGNLVQQTFTAGFGIYTFDNDTGSYILDIDTIGLPFLITCPANGIDTANLSTFDSLQNHNFALQCKPGFDLAAQSVYTDVFRPASFTQVHVAAGDAANFWNQSCNTTGLSGQVVITINGPARYIAPAAGGLTPVVSGNTLTYSINDWSAVNGAQAFNMIVQTDTTAPLGAQVCFDVNITPTAGDNNPTNNHLTYCATVVNSYDPNIKEVYPLNNVDVAGNHWLTYNVRFQNTGNAPAENIYITDTLDSDLDESTFQLLAYSFAPQVSLKGHAVRFNFANINLADSLHDEPNSHGYVQYKVKVKDNATVGTVINNTAFIYFDFNAPVVTNTTTNTLTLFEGINTPPATATMQVYPNPAQDLVMINLSDNISGGTLTLSDVTGRSLNSISITSSHNQLNTSALSSGVYLITAVKGGARVVQRLVVSK